MKCYVCGREFMSTTDTQGGSFRCVGCRAKSMKQEKQAVISVYDDAPVTDYQLQVDEDMREDVRLWQAILGAVVGGLVIGVIISMWWIKQ